MSTDIVNDSILDVTVSAESMVLSAATTAAAAAAVTTTSVPTNEELNDASTNIASSRTKRVRIPKSRKGPNSPPTSDEESAGDAAAPTIPTTSAIASVSSSSTNNVPSRKKFKSSAPPDAAVTVLGANGNETIPIVSLQMPPHRSHSVPLKSKSHESSDHSDALLVLASASASASANPSVNNSPIESPRSSVSDGPDIDGKLKKKSDPRRNATSMLEEVDICLEDGMLEADADLLDELNLSAHELVRMDTKGLNAMAARTSMTWNQLINIKQLRRRVKNRLAAQVCRQRKKKMLENMEDEVDILTREHTELRERVYDAQLEFEAFHRINEAKLLRNNEAWEEANQLRNELSLHLPAETPAQQKERHDIASDLTRMAFMLNSTDTLHR